MTLKTAEFQQTSAYSMRRVRATYDDASRSKPGASDGGWVITSTSPTPTMNVTVSAGSFIYNGALIGAGGFYHVENDALITLAVANAHATLPRIDQVVLAVTDAVDGGGGSDGATISVVSGTPTSGATLENRSGAATLTSSQVRLADILVGNAVSSISSSFIRQRKAFSRGISTHLSQGTSTDKLISTGSGITTAIGTPSVYQFDASSMLRLEVTDPTNPIFLQMHATYALTTQDVITLPALLQVMPIYNTTYLGGATGTWVPMDGLLSQGIMIQALNQNMSFFLDHWWTPPAAGHYTITLSSYLVASPAANAAVVTLRGTSVVANTFPIFTLAENPFPVQTNRPT